MNINDLRKSLVAGIALDVPKEAKAQTGLQLAEELEVEAQASIYVNFLQRAEDAPESRFRLPLFAVPLEDSEDGAFLVKHLRLAAAKKAADILKRLRAMGMKPELERRISVEILVAGERIYMLEARPLSEPLKVTPSYVLEREAAKPLKAFPVGP